jgi:hypothetical protein
MGVSFPVGRLGFYEVSGQKPLFSAISCFYAAFVKARWDEKFDISPHGTEQAIGPSSMT